VRPGARTGRPAPTRTRRRAALALAALAGVTIAACATESVEHAGVRPLTGSGAAPSSSTTAAATPTTTPTISDRAAPAPTTTDGGAPPALPEEPAQVALVATALHRYDVALSRLAAAPGAADVPGPLLQEWHAAVVPGSRLSDAMLDHVRGAPGAEPTHVVPGADGLSYRHHVLTTSAEPGRVGFTWCGYSPGVRVRSADTAVVDAEVGHAHGVGELRDLGSGWQLASLDQLDLVVLPPGSPDPCVPAP